MSLRARFSSAFAELGLAVPEQAFERVLAAYAEPHRRYHTLAHIEHCLGWLDWAWASARHPYEVALALWYHDVVYDPARSDNEAQSAAVLRAELMRAGASEPVIARSEALIMATREHHASEGDAALVVDIDLAILGAENAVFAAFERNVRVEYAAYDDATYARGRARVLESLLAKSPLYVTPLFAAELASAARINLTQAVERARAPR
jgi:predicted metal-dependent HD superfamily phosphohydrolase